MLLTLTVIGDSFINQGDCLPGNALNVHVLLQPAVMSAGLSSSVYRDARIYAHHVLYIV